jgi:hypothetical protein
MYIVYTSTRDRESGDDSSHVNGLNARLVVVVRLLFGYQLLVQFENRNLFNERYLFLISGHDGSPLTFTGWKNLLVPIFLIPPKCWTILNGPEGILYYGFFMTICI